MTDSSFQILREIGNILLAKGESIRFSLDAYRGFRYISIRRYLTTEGFSGATRDGITLTPEIVRALAPRIASLPEGVKSITPTQLGKFAKRPGVCVIASIGVFKGKPGFELCQQYEGDIKTKKGIWLSLEHVTEIKRLFKETCSALEEMVVDDF